MSNDDKLRVDEVTGWIEWLRNPMNASLVGADLIDKLTDEAVRAVKNAAVSGEIRRGDAVRAIREAIPEMPPDDLDGWRKSKWGTLRAMFAEVVYYAKGEEDHHET